MRPAVAKTIGPQALVLPKDQVQRLAAIGAAVSAPSLARLWQLLMKAYAEVRTRARSGGGGGNGADPARLRGGSAGARGGAEGVAGRRAAVCAPALVARTFRRRIHGARRSGDPSWRPNPSRRPARRCAASTMSSP